MLAKLKDGFKGEQTNGFIKVIKTKRNGLRLLLNNLLWYDKHSLDLKKESGGLRSRKPKQEVIKVEEEKKKIKIDIGRINQELKNGEYEEIIKMKEKECDSWMRDFNEAKKEKLFYERKYLEKGNEIKEEILKNIGLSERISLLIELQEQLRNKKDMWKNLFLINIFIDVTYLVIKYLWI